ncbi:MAG: pseudouridine synthase [Pseudomonadota bacterium]
MPLILLNKPHRVLSQFTTDGDKQTLADYVDTAAVYPAGRLDYDSEGLLLLTNDGRLQSAITDPKHRLAKRYLAQVEGVADSLALDRLIAGVRLKDGPAKAVSATLAEPPDWLWARQPPIRERKSVPDCWIELVITEGRNRQVRRMTASVGLPTLRLIRTHIGPWSVDDLSPGETRSIPVNDAWSEIRR